MMDELLVLIEKTRLKMFEAYDLFGIRDARTLALSQELDELENQFNRLK